MSWGGFKSLPFYCIHFSLYNWCEEVGEVQCLAIITAVQCTGGDLCCAPQYTTDVDKWCHRTWLWQTRLCPLSTSGWLLYHCATWTVCYCSSVIWQRERGQQCPHCCTHTWDQHLVSLSIKPRRSAHLILHSQSQGSLKLVGRPTGTAAPVCSTEQWKHRDCAVAYGTVLSYTNTYHPVTHLLLYWYLLSEQIVNRLCKLLCDSHLLYASSCIHKSYRKSLLAFKCQFLWSCVSAHSAITERRIVPMYWKVTDHPNKVLLCRVVPCIWAHWLCCLGTVIVYKPKCTSRVQLSYHMVWNRHYYLCMYTGG